MNNLNLLIFRVPILYKILQELDQDLNFNVKEIKSEDLLKKEIKNLKNYIVISKKKISNLGNQIIFDKFPIKILKLVEKVNVEYMKSQFGYQSKYNINNYIIDLNSRELTFNNIKLKLTEKEVNTIIYLSKKNKPVNINELERDVWKYKSDMETHTVETHIYRLRKKILKIFKDENFIVSDKNGYKIN
tara:strand:- start:4183 stop:4746 length:564 start_codon:yes stop_codon:yes gene_type:complete